MGFRYTIILVAMLALGACSNAKADNDDAQRAAGEVGENKNADNIPRMVAVHASYCSVCHKMQPLVDRIASKCNDRTLEIDIVDISAQDDEYLVEDYSIVALPTYLFIDAHGHEVARLVGAQTDSTIEQALAVITGKQCQGLGRVKKGAQHIDKS